MPPPGAPPEAGRPPAELARAYALRELGRRLLKTSWAFALIGFGFGYKRSLGVAPNGTDLFLAIAAFALIAWVVHGAFVGTPDDEDRWRRAVGEQRWADALGLLPRLARVVPAAHLPLIEAQALAGLGRKREAEAKVEAADRTQMATWEYWTLLAAVREAAGDEPGRRAALEAALPHAPSPREVLFGLAELSLMLDADPAAARAFVDRVHDRARLAPNAARQLCLEGMIAAEANAPDAGPTLERALTAAEEERARSPEMTRVVAHAHAFLGLWTARQGRLGEARVHAREAVPVLRRMGHFALVRRLKEELRS